MEKLLLLKVEWGLDHKTVIITGANSGLGFETAKKIAKNQNYRVILACRNKEKADKAKEDIVNETKNENIITMIIDTSSLKSVRNFVQEFKKLNIKLDRLICNSSELSYNQDNRLELWNKSVEWTNLKDNETLNRILK